jgi:hypothetical protein
MIVYRIVHVKYSKSLFASGQEGRWNSAGNKVIYCAESIALAFLESMLRRQGVGFNQDFVTMIIEIPDTVSTKQILANTLPYGWRAARAYRPCQAIGDKWYAEAKHALLYVPSAVLPESSNYVINTVHPDFQKIKLLGTSYLEPDERLETLLKGRKTK